jgi:hypothetical protein
MTDYSEQGAIPVDDAAVDDPPTEEEVRAAQQRNYPEQAATADGRPGEPGAAGDDDEGNHPTD